MIIEIRNLFKHFDDGREVLRDINLADDISTMSIIGPSGGGKSTLLRVIGGLLTPSSGTVVIDGEALPDTEQGRIRFRQRLGFVFQQGGLFSHLTGLRNITLPLVKVHGFTVMEAEKRAKELLDRFGLMDDAHKKPGALSGGQKQRVAIARAVAPRPKLLLLDEPTSALDPEYTNEVLDMIKELRDEGLHFLIVTHEMGFALHACEKTSFLYDGSLMEYGSSTDILANPQAPQLSRFLSRLLEWDL